jgi:hypothetical protein
MPPVSWFGDRRIAEKTTDRSVATIRRDAGKRGLTHGSDRATTTLMRAPLGCPMNARFDR